MPVAEWLLGTLEGVVAKLVRVEVMGRLVKVEVPL
jgi:hypothetical protein